jgi:hypothetical protein
VYKESIRQFESTQLCAQLKQLIVPHLMQTKITKIVAFGRSTLTPFYDIRNTLRTPLLHAQHAALEAIRSVWEEHRPSETTELQIFLRDPQYCELDKHVAEIHSMEVVNCSFGHQMGWLQVDESTLVVNLRACFPIERVSFEITRPASFLCGDPYKSYSESISDKPWWSLALTKMGKMIEVPGLCTSIEE